MARSGGVGNNYTHQRERVAIAICKDVKTESQERDVKASSTWRARAVVPQISCSDLQVSKNPCWPRDDCSGKCKSDVKCAEDSCYEHGMACSSRATEFVEACGQGFAVRNERSIIRAVG
jgi:uncharacterized protein YfaT (DUF1175 family)